MGVWAERLFEANVLPEKKTIAEQHKEARRLLPLLFEATRENSPMTYADAVKALGWALRGSAHAMGEIIDLLYAAAPLARPPYGARQRRLRSQL